MSSAAETVAVRPATWQVRKVTFVGPYWPVQNRVAALEGINGSEGARRYRVYAVEVPSGGLPVAFADHRNLLGSAVNAGAIRQASMSGCRVNGSFHPTEGIAINADHRSSPKSIRHIAGHEADHWSGRATTHFLSRPEIVGADFRRSDSGVDELGAVAG